MFSYYTTPLPNISQIKGPKIRRLLIFIWFKSASTRILWLLNGEMFGRVIVSCFDGKQREDRRLQE